MNRTKRIAYSCMLMLAVLIAGAGCGKSSSSDSSGGTSGPVAGAPAAFGMLAPANNATDVSFTPTFTWENTSGETGYILQVSLDAAFTTPLKYENAAIAADTTSFTLPTGLLVAGTTYYWKVTAVNAVAVTAGTGAPFSFTTAASGVWSTASNPSGSFDEVQGMAKDGSSLYLVGYDSKAGYPGWRIEKRNTSDGSLVSAFGTGGVISGVTASRSVAFAAVVDGSSLYVVGYEVLSGIRKWRIEKRSLSTGALVTTFGDAFSGVANSGTAADAVANAIAADSANMYVAGYDTSAGGNLEWRVEKRDLASGTLVNAFGANGIVQSNPSVLSDIANGIAVDASNVYIVGWDGTSGGASAWRIEMLNVATGATITAVSESALGYGGKAYAIAIDSTAMYVVGYDEQPGSANTQWRIEKRQLSNSALVSSFGVNGVIQENPTGSFDDAQAVAIDSTHLYVAGYDSGATSSGDRWRVEKRLLTDGSPVTLFGTGGVASSNGSPDFNRPWAIMVDSTYYYCAGYDSSVSSADEQWRIEKRDK